MARVQQRVKEGAAEPRSSGNRPLLLGGLLVALIAIVAVLALLGRGTGGTAGADAFEGLEAEGMFLGDPAAPLLVRDFSDFKCPHCGTAATQLTPRIIEEYVRSGQVRLEFIPVAVVSQESVASAEAAMCAAEQDLFWPYQELLFARQRTEAFTPENLVRLAEEVGVNRQEFTECLLTGQHTAQLQANNDEFRRVGATGTPTFIVGDELIGGAVPFSEIEPVIQAQLGQ